MNRLQDAAVAPVLPMAAITSRHNPCFKALRALVHSSQAYKQQGRVWLEGEHLCRAWLDKNKGGIHKEETPLQLVCRASQWGHWQAVLGLPLSFDGWVLLSDALMAQLSPLPSPAPLGLVVPWPGGQSIGPALRTLVLDGVQDPGNVGSVLRSAAAFGIEQVLALQGTAALWSNKVLRAGMGAHFALHLVENVSVAEVLAWPRPLLITHPHQGAYLHVLAAQQQLPAEGVWVFGNEGAGVQPALAQRTGHPVLFVRIAQPGGQESLGVAAAAAVCLHASGVGVQAMKGA